MELRTFEINYYRPAFFDCNPLPIFRCVQIWKPFTKIHRICQAAGILMEIADFAICQIGSHFDHQTLCGKPLIIKISEKPSSNDGVLTLQCILAN
jgi:hypothetical protein